MNFSQLTASLTRLTEDNKNRKKRISSHDIILSEEARKTFEALKTAFTTESILVQFDLDRKTIIKTDFSD